MTGYQVLLASLCQSLSFCWFATDVCDWNTCQIFRGSTAYILAGSVWAVCGVMILCRYPKPNIVLQPQQGDGVVAPSDDLELAEDQGDYKGKKDDKDVELTEQSKAEDPEMIRPQAELS